MTPLRSTIGESDPASIGPQPMIARRPRSTATIALLLLWGMAGSADGADARRGASIPGVEPVREIRESAHLRANASNAVRYVVKGVCERQGTLEISRILQHSDFEEMWAFLPRARDTGDCQWHEIGREEKSESHRSTVRVDLGYLLDLLAENTEIHLVHFHPLRYFECAAHAGCPKQARAGSFDQRWIADLVFSMPSPSDVHFMMDVTSRFHRRHRGGGTIRHRVVTPHGVVDYGLTGAGLAKFDSERHGRSDGLYITWVVASALDSERVELVVREGPRSLAGAVARLAQTLNTEFLRVVHSANPAPANAGP
jgi:hypothetical protein